MCIKTFPNLILEIYLWNWKCSYPISSLQCVKLREALKIKFILFPIFFNKNTIIFWHDFFGWLFRKMMQGLGLFGLYPVAMIFTVCVWVLTSGSTFPKDSPSFENCGSQLLCGWNKPCWLLCCGTQMSTWFKTCNTHYINQRWREGINQSISLFTILGSCDGDQGVRFFRSTSGKYISGGKLVLAWLAVCGRDW